MRPRSAFALVLAVLLFAPDAKADVPPPNACGPAGAACSTAGDAYNQPGVCAVTKCERTLMGPDGPKTYENDCNLCVLKGAAAPSADATSAGATSGGTAASGTVSSGSLGAESSSGTGVQPEALPAHGGCAGCSVAEGRAGVAAFLGIMGAALFAGTLGARRRARAKRG